MFDTPPKIKLHILVNEYILQAGGGLQFGDAELQKKATKQEIIDVALRQMDKKPLIPETEEAKDKEKKKGDNKDKKYSIRTEETLHDFTQRVESEIQQQGKSGEKANEQGTGVRYSMNLEQVNEQFNNELQQQIDGTLPKGHIYQLGMPSEILQSAGIQDLPMELSAQRLKEKSEQANNIFDIADLKDLPKAINDPIAVFNSRTHTDNSKVILTELQYKGNNFVAILRVDKNGELDIDINAINNLYPKDSVIGIYRWLDLGLLLYRDEKKLTDFIAQSTDLIANDNLRKSAAKVVKDFENPKLSSEKR